MKKFLAVIVFSLLLIGVNSVSAQKSSWIVGGKIGMNIDASTGGGVALQFGPMGEYVFGPGFAVGTELTINTFTGTPIAWVDYFKYYFSIRGSSIKPYAHTGIGLIFATGGPYFAILFGGGANFPVAKNLYIPADLTLGPIFYSVKAGGVSYSGTRFSISITSGIRYYIN